MVNNEFHLIGTAISNFNDIGNGKFKSYLLRLEIEKFGSKSGNTFTIEVQIYGTNKAIDTRTEILGKQVAVNGYIDAFITKEGSLITKLVAQNIYVVGKVVNARDMSVVAGDDHGEAQPQTEESYSDDDLPF